MRTDQLDAYRTELETRVVAVDARDADREDGAVWISLADSVFYPTSGGQPHDTGRIVHAGGAARVIDVVADGLEAVRHRVLGDVPEVGAAVRAEIDWARRYRHMQRHSAQHLLSQAFLRLGPAFETRSVALTSPDATVDLAGEPDDEAVAAAFAVARDWAYANLPIDAFEVDESEIDRYPLRRPPKVEGRIRLVRMGDVELSACGGTHLRSTAEALPLLALGRQRIRGGLTRVTFRAGREAGERAEATVEVADALARSFSARWDELPDRVDALREEARAAQRDAADARAAWADLRVRAALAEGRAVGGPGAAGGGRLLVRIVADDAAALAALASAATEAAPSAVALLAARTEDRATVLLQAGPDAGDDVDLRPTLAEALPHVGGRGGGKPDRVQGAGPEPDGIEAALDAAEAELAARATAS